jgi:hypothetical protein
MYDREDRLGVTVYLCRPAYLQALSTETTPPPSG